MSEHLNEDEIWEPEKLATPIRERADSHASTCAVCSGLSNWVKYLKSSFQRDCLGSRSSHQFLRNVMDRIDAENPRRSWVATLREMLFPAVAVATACVLMVLRFEDLSGVSEFPAEDTSVGIFWMENEDELLGANEVL